MAENTVWPTQVWMMEYIFNDYNFSNKCSIYNLKTGLMVKIQDRNFDRHDICIYNIFIHERNPNKPDSDEIFKFNWFRDNKDNKRDNKRRNKFHFGYISNKLNSLGQSQCYITI